MVDAVPDTAPVDAVQAALVASDVPARVHDVVLLDLDGVVYVGPSAVPGAVAALAAVEAAGARTAFVTNNASRPASAVAAHLRDIGIRVDDATVVTSAQAGAEFLAGRLPAGSAVLAIGGPGVSLALQTVGLMPVASAEEAPVAVLQGYGPDVGWRLLAEGAYALASGALWVATNTDATIPTPRGIAPGNGALVDVLAATTGRHPIVVGKPEPPLLQSAVRRTHASRPIMVGDRLDTDILGGRRCGMPALVVMTGVTDVRALVGAPASHRPQLLALDLAGLLEPHPRPTPVADGWQSGNQAAIVEAGSVRLVAVPAPAPGRMPTSTPAPMPAPRAASIPAEVPGPSTAAGGLDDDHPERRLVVQDRLRALAMLAWQAGDSGVDLDAGAAIAQLQDDLDAALAFVAAD